jgi:hypothetical protein
MDNAAMKITASETVNAIFTRRGDEKNMVVTSRLHRNSSMNDTVRSSKVGEPGVARSAGVVVQALSRIEPHIGFEARLHVG